MITQERAADLNSMRESLTIALLLTLTADELEFIAFNDTHNKLRANLKNLVLSADSRQLIDILNSFNDTPAFYFLEDLICTGEVASMTEDQYWDYIARQLP